MMLAGCRLRIGFDRHGAVTHATQATTAPMSFATQGGPWARKFWLFRTSCSVSVVGGPFSVVGREANVCGPRDRLSFLNDCQSGHVPGSPIAATPKAVTQMTQG